MPCLTAVKNLVRKDWGNIRTARASRSPSSKPDAAAGDPARFRLTTVEFGGP